MWAHRPNLMRAAFGEVPIFTPATFGQCALFNNSPGPHLLRVWAMSDRGSNTFGLSVQQSRLATKDVGVITPAVTGEPAPPGTLDRTDVPVAPAPNFNQVTQLSISSIISATAPFVVLRPGWSLVATEITAAAALGVCFWWDYVFPIELLKPDIGDPDIDD